MNPGKGVAGPSTGRRLKRLWQRHRAHVAAAAWAVLLFGGIAFFFWLIWSPPR
jgi:hypothetical protein